VNLKSVIRAAMKSVTAFSSAASGITLRPYQAAAAEAIVDSVFKKKGLSFVVIFPRQSGKNELQAAVETYILWMLSTVPGTEIVKVSPTWRPQCQNSMRRLDRILSRNLITRTQWQKESAYIFRLGQARITFLSALPTTNVVGSTATALLACDEAQDILPAKWDKDFVPMGASANATRVFYGTAWTSTTLLAREKRAALEAEKQDGIQRVFEITADQIRQDVPLYGQFVDGEIARHGRNNPYIRTQYFNEEIDESIGMFTAERLALMQGTHISQLAPRQGHTYVFTIDVGGEQFNAESGADHDTTALTIYDIITQQQPIYNIVSRQQWTGRSHARLAEHISALIEQWQPYRVVVDATGVGEGLASMLINIYRSKIIPFKFTQASKSDLGWAFISAIETGRIKDFVDPTPDFRNMPIHDNSQVILQAQFVEQCQRISFEVLPGPGQVCRWSIPTNARSFTTGELLHDDLVLSAALIFGIPDKVFLGSTDSIIIHATDPLDDMRF